ncbi:hypothetical protein A2304_01545 [Candidatus Uhrbacteria bacterium RIFOXYB2_FULL_57_15]|uniref:Regulator of chromosome condensation n=1 Tax=Candidatus Uhrbacteria bacterium RIFOXYB2_FULL_57_15 TaxID=1802422 RepID=A0A1F7W6D3_9BACT|nr:MAG: hypothetical protein A2304_01545 [Candidatus Uhrbacteria bacterium RIFOXYB2_FULL_57_15]
MQIITLLALAGIAGCYLSDIDGDGVPDKADCDPHSRANDCGSDSGSVGDIGDSGNSGDTGDDITFGDSGDTGDDTGDTGTPCDLIVWHRDADLDGYGSATVTTEACIQPDGYVDNGDDCDDADATSYPGAPERCDGADNDCDDDGEIDENASEIWYNDRDSDGYGNADEFVVTVCDGESDWLVDNGDDCDDGDADVHPYAAEYCNDIDDDCDDDIDEDAVDQSEWYADADGDGSGNWLDNAWSCIQPDGYVDNGDDCDDLDGSVYPGADETCNGLDDDCDGIVPTDETDADGDGTSECDGDCDGSDGSVYPGATETCNDVDDDCDGVTDESDAADVATWYGDVDGDGYGDSATTFASCSAPAGYVADATDCDDGNASVHPGADETCNGLDDDCDGTTDGDDATDAALWYADADGDGAGDEDVFEVACDQPSGSVADDTDCDDADAGNYPGNVETCDGADNDCDGTADESDAIDASIWYADADADGYGDSATPETACDQPTGFVADDSDCDDGNDAVHPGAIETCNALDDDCDGSTDGDDAVDQATWYEDGDSDGYGNDAETATACDQPSGFAALGGDCDDADFTVSPGAYETCDDVDDDCDGAVDEDDAIDAPTWYFDRDLDGYGASSAYDTVSCSAPSVDFTDNADDCYDYNDDIHPGADDVCADGVDQDCDGVDAACDDIDDTGATDTGA